VSGCSRPVSVERPMRTRADGAPDGATVAAATHSRPTAPVPDHALLAVLRREALRRGLPAPMRIRERLPWIYQSTAAAEILECVLASGAEWRVLWKHGVSAARDPADSRRGVAYETQVYEHILAPGGYGPPRFLGAAQDSATDEDWLFAEFVSAGVRLSAFPLEVARSAAGWLGQFHRAFEHSPIAPRATFLRRYDEAWYRDWVVRAAAVLERDGRRTPDLDAVIDGCRDRLPRLLETPTTLIHGEFYPDNILVDRAAIRPVDWESAAVAAGEIDLATLTEGWSSADEAVLVDRYRATRWEGREPGGFEERYQAARAYSACRRLGDRVGWTAEADRYLAQLLDAAARLGPAEPTGRSA
jgi:hypothetical protein